MQMKLSSARLKLIAIAEQNLGRALTGVEHKTACGLAEPVVEFVLRERRPSEIVGMLHEIGGEESPVVFLDDLANSAETLVANREKILARLKPKARKIVATLDFDRAVEEIEKWFVALLKMEPPPLKIRALSFGLVEAGRGCQLYVCGADKYDADDCAWACDPAWWPEGRYAPSGELSALWQPLKKAGEEPWIVVQAIVIVLVRAMFEAHGVEFGKLFKRKNLFVASGFDDGDLYTIRTVLSPKE